ncbi:MAG: hypothetical protein SNG59_08225 [Rikenellaceae bacterium]
MKTNNNIYVAPQVEVIEIEIEDVVLSGSGDGSTEYGFSATDLLESTGRF